MPDDTSPNYSDSPEKSAFALAEQGTLEIIELMGAADRLKSAGLKDQTINLYRLWLERTTSPLAYVAYFNLGVELASEREYSQAETVYRKAIEISPGFTRARLNLGNCLEQQKREEEALEQWRLALETESILLPENQALRLHALNNMGRLYEVKKNYKDSLDKLEESFAVDPTQRDVLLHLVHLIQKICRWPVFVPPKGITKDEMIAGTSPLAMLAASDDPKLQLAAAQQFIEHKYPKLNPEPLAPKGGYNHKRVRIGYLSSDFCLHAVSLLMVELLELHNHDQFEVYGFCWSRVDDTLIQRRVQKSMDHYIKIGEMSDKEAADCIRSHEIDIMVDLQGLTSGARPLILSHRPAPLQVTYLGFPGTTGLPWIDYVISDKYLIPEELAPFHTEKPLYMPNCFQSSDSKREVGSMPTRADNELPEKAFVFCSFNNNYKFTPEVFAAWMRILKRVPKSVFWLLADNEWSKESLLKEAKKHGIKNDRLIFAPRVAPADYLARYQLADLFLDTFPFNGGTTANDALFMGLPLLTLSGQTFASRMAGSLLMHLELPELITTNLKEYEDKAVRLAKKPVELRKLKARLKGNKESGPVFDMPRFVKGYEQGIAAVLRELEANASTDIEIKNRAAENRDARTESKANLPLVSILIPSYKPQYFDFALRSAIAQSYENIEIVVSDDCPDDGIKKIVERYRSIATIRYERNPNPDGIQFNNLVNCLRLARGEYVKFLFDDDLLMPFCVQYMVDVFLTNAAFNPRLVLSERWTIDSKGSYTGTYKLPLTGLNDITNTYVERNMALQRGNALGEFTTAMWRREDSFDNEGCPLFGQIDGREILAMPDVALFINLSRLGRVLYISLPLSCFRKHDGSNSSARESKWFYRLFTEWEIIIEQALARNLVTFEEAVASLEALEQQNRYRETLVPSLVGHSDRLAKKIMEMKNRHNYFCPVCEQWVDGYLPLPDYYKQQPELHGSTYSLDDYETLNCKQYSCPNCHSSDRDRLYALYIREKAAKNNSDRTFDLVELAPSRPLGQMILKLGTFKLRTADLYMEGVDDNVDIENMAIYADASFDCFICSHVLEHVTDDGKAIRELKRILKPEGWGILMVPIMLSLNEIDEDPNVTDEGERWGRFGQNDHVRMYSKNGFIERLAAAGFTVNQYGSEHFGNTIFKKSGIAEKSILYVVENKN